MSTPYGGLTGKTKTLGLDYSVAGLLAYLPICCISVICSIIWLTSEPKENKVLRFHAMQSLLLMGVGLVCFVLFLILGMVVAGAGSATDSPGVAVGGSLLLLLVELVVAAIFLIVIIVAMVKAYQGQIWKIPVIGNIADKNT